MWTRLKDGFSNFADKAPAAANALGLATLLTFSGAANGNDKSLYTANTAQTNPVSIQTAPTSALEQAGDFGLSGRDNVGIIVYYGKGNGNTPEEFGAYVAKKVSDAAALRGEQINPKYFITHLNDNTTGVVLAYHMGGASVGPIDIRDGITEDTLKEVLDLRARSRNFLAANHDI